MSDVTPGHFQLTAEQRRFKALAVSTKLSHYWDFEKRDCDLQAIEKATGTLSHGEAIMLRFLTAVWLGENQFQFDLIDAVKTLDEHHTGIIQAWIADPFFP